MTLKINVQKENRCGGNKRHYIFRLARSTTALESFVSTDLQSFYHLHRVAMFDIFRIKVEPANSGALELFGNPPPLRSINEFLESRQSPDAATTAVRTSVISLGTVRSVTERAKL
jgi:hypothetical protein